jgi:hypothetical protein
MAAGATYEPIATTTLGSSQSSVTFSSISGSYTDLVLVVGGTASVYDGLVIQVGNTSIDTGSNYSVTGIQGDGTSATSYRETSQTTINAGLQGANFNNIYQFMNYSNTTTHKTILSRGNSPANNTRAAVGLWRSTSAINTIKIISGTGTLSSGTVLTLYGIKAA